MELKLTEGKYFYEGKVPFNLFERDIIIYVDKERADFAFAEKVAASLNQMSAELIDKLCKYSVFYCNEFCDEVGEEPPEISTNKDVLKYIRPTILSVKFPEDDSIVIRLEFNCDWESEHGIEWLIKDDKVLYVGAFSDMSPYLDEEEYNKSWNYARQLN